MTRLAGGIDEVVSVDAVVVGSGVAGLTAALGLADRRLALLTKGRYGRDGASAMAMGGVAAAMDPTDDPSLHASDTLAVAGGLGDPLVVELLTAEAPRQVRRLAALGARFDIEATGRLALGREAAHSRSRIVHARGDATGAELVDTLARAVVAAPGVSIERSVRAERLLTGSSGIRGVVARRADGRTVLFATPVVALCSGGIGRLYSRTTNPPEATADGLALAALAGAWLADLEFVQFHPTALALGGDPLPLLTEALRGAGALLVDRRGRRFMLDVDRRGELAPRDVVARAVWELERAGHRAFLDATSIGDRFPERFPTVWEACRRRGLDPRVEPMPVTPAMHYHMGGVATDDRGRTSVPGLWAAGEVARTGAHGANRLASNSLLEAMVFGARLAADVGATLARGDRPAPPVALPGPAAAASLERSSREEIESELRELMWRRVGLVRDGRGLGEAIERIEHWARAVPEGAAPELENLLLAGRLVATAASARRETRGAHCRRDFPRPDAVMARSIRVRLEGGSPLSALRVAWSRGDVRSARGAGS